MARTTEVQSKGAKRSQSDIAALRNTTRSAQFAVLSSERESKILANVAKALAKPGLTREQIFGGATGRVYAYSVYPKDPSKIVREDVSGKKVLGRFSGGRFRPLSHRAAI